MSIFPRERVTEAIRESVNRGFGLVVAPAGFGKTEAVLDAYGTAARWVTVAEGAASVEGLARAIIAAAAPQSLRALSPLLTRPADAENRAHLTSWVGARLRSVEEPIVLDDFQRVCDDEAVLTFTRDVIQATVPHVRWLIVSRETPELPIGTWLARDYMTFPLTIEDLSFDRDEAAGVAAAMRVTIDDGALETLVHDVSGWPLALRLALGAWERTRALPPLRLRTRQLLFDFLDSEIWQSLSGEEREFFETAACLGELNPRVLHAAGFHDARLTLDRLHRRLPLVTRLPNGTFRLHDLFRDFIRERAATDPERLAERTHRLARALERFGTFEQALAMTMQAGDWPSALKLLAKRGVDRIEGGHRAEITAALGGFPAAQRDHPVIVGLRGYSLAIDGAFDLARREIDKALRGELDNALRGALDLQRGAMLVNLREYPEAIAVLRSAMSNERYESDVRMKAAAILALTCAISGDGAAARDAISFCAGGLDAGSVEVRAIVRHRIAYAYHCLGEYALAEHYASECAELAHSIGVESIAARAYSILANTVMMTYADAALMRRHAEACLRSAEASGDRAMQLFALESLVYIAGLQGDDVLLDGAVAQYRAIPGNTRRANVVLLAFVMALRDAGCGYPERAIAEMQRLDRAKQSASESAFIDAVLAVLHTIREPERAETLLTGPVLSLADPDRESQRFLTFAQAFHALAHWLVGRGRAARRARLPNPADLAPGDAAVINVIATMCGTSRQSVSARQIEQLTEPLVALGFGGYARFLRAVAKPAAVHELTRTELAVLRSLRDGNTTAEVADLLGRSSNTVLSHIKSACTKLGCSGRMAAVSIAAEHGWLD